MADALLRHSGPLKYSGVESYTQNWQRESEYAVHKMGFCFTDQTSQASTTGPALATVNSLADLDDRNLVLEAQAGNRAAFEELVQRYDRDVLRLAMNLMKTDRRCP